MPQASPISDEYFCYFAYGSNLLEERIHVQIKGAIFKGIGVLYGYKLEFFDHSQRWMGALASIETADQRDEVWGCIWHVPLSYLCELDKQEKNYNRIIVEVKGDVITSCWTYQYANQKRQKADPSPHYKRVIVSGALEHKLPSSYVKKLQMIKDNGYTGPIALQLAVIKDINRQPTGVPACVHIT